MKDQETETKDLICRAFDKELHNERKLSHSECVELRHSIIRLYDSDIVRFLPQVLIDLVDTHTNDYGNTEDIEEVVFTLL